MARHGCIFRNTSVSAFVMSADSALVAVRHDRSTEERPEVLALIESSANARGDLARANDAHYALEVLKSAHYSPPLRLLDLVFYRTIAGYFVRPLHPLLAVLALAALVTIRQDGPPPPAGRRAGPPDRGGRCCAAGTQPRDGRSRLSTASARRSS